MKKIRILLLVLAVVLVLAGCGDRSASSSSATETQQIADSIQEGRSASPAATPLPETSPEAFATPSATVPEPVPSASPSEDSSSAQSPALSASPKPSPSPEPSTAPSSSPKASQQPPKIHPPKASPTVESITISIVGNAEWGTIVNAESIQLAQGDTAASVLKRTAKAHRLAFETTGSGELTYVQGIDGLYEFDDGPTSGWKYRVNGKVLDIGAGSYKLQPGDRLEWFYTSEDEAAKEGKESSP